MSAKIMVIKKNGENGQSQYVNLYRTESLPKYLFSVHFLVKKHNAGFEIKKNGAFWSWKSQGCAKGGRFGECIFACITNDNHQVIIEGFGKTNVGTSCKMMIVCSSDIQYIPA